MAAVEEIRRELDSIRDDDSSRLESFLEVYADDSRAGVVSLLKKAKRRLDKLAAEHSRLEAMKSYERDCRSRGYSIICGIDEAGRGPLAGPVVAGAVILPEDCEIPGLNDSKKLTEKKREELFDKICEKALAYGTGIVGPSRIDEINILQADYEAMCEAIGSLKLMPQVLLNDAVLIPQVKIEQIPIVHGDAKSVSIAAASILAKVTRDRLMLEYDALFPEYGFAAHKGYGTAAHYEAIFKYGPSPIHRRSFLKNLEEHRQKQ